MQKQAHACDARTIIYVGGNRSGKSTLGVTELSYHLTRQYPSWFSKVRRFKRPIKAFVSATDFPVVQRVIEPKIKQYLPSDYYHVERSNKYLSRIYCIDGSTVDILTGEMKDESYESADWDFGWMDEPQQERKYQGIRRGLVDRKGMLVLTFTPLTEPWMKEKLVDVADGKSIVCFQVDIRDNKWDEEGNAILEEDSIKEFEKSLPEDVRDSRIHGKFFHLRGLIYREFSEVHVKDFEYQYPDPVLCVLDPHDRQPHHVLWAFIDRNDDLHVDFEYNKHIELDELARVIRAIEKQRGYKVRKRIIDPNFGRKPFSVGNNRSVIQELGFHGTPFTEADDNKELGHMVVRDYLHWDSTKQLTATNCPKLYFSRTRVPNTIRSIKNAQYDEWAGGSRDRDPKEKPKDKDTHGADCIRYLCIGKPSYRGLADYDYSELEAVPY